MSDLEKIIGQAAGRALKHMNVTGFSVAVVKDGKTLFTGGFGYANKKTKEKMTGHHLLPIGSSSKAFTATGVVLLADEGKIDLDKPARDYMPRFKLSDPEATSNATLRDLLCHRTGMPRHDLMWICRDQATREELVFECLPNLPATKPFRSVWQYQNYMYAASGCAIEQVSGLSWEDFTRKRIFKPLKMDMTGFLTDNKNKEMAYSTLYKPDEKNINQTVVAENVLAIGPAGSILSSAEDMSKWLLFNLSKGRAGKKPLMKDESFAQLWKCNIPYELMPFEIPEVKHIGYGLGWFLDSYRGRLRVDHGGNLSGASALVSMLPEENIGVVILTNADSSFLTYAMAALIQDALLGIEKGTDWIAFYQEKRDSLKKQSDDGIAAFYKTKLKNKPVTHSLNEYAGTYVNPGYGELKISAEKKQLTLKFYGLTTPLVHMHYDIFYLLIHGMPLPVTFKTGMDGSIESVSVQFEPTLPQFIEFKHQPKELSK